MPVLFYNLLAWCVLPFAVLYHWYRSLSRGRATAFDERFGRLSPAARKTLAGHPVIWLHAVSVGEVIAARPLLRGLKRQYPQHRLLLSVTTETGRGVAERDHLADLVIYFPFDVPFAVRRLLAATKPQLIIVMETEIWPVFIFEASRRKIPLILANGRISDRSFPRYQRFAWFFRPVLRRFHCLGMQSTADRERIIAIGAPSERTQLLGNLKYDIPCHQTSGEERRILRERYTIPAESLVITFASTHPNEELLLLGVMQKLAHYGDQLRFVLVPRHPERSSEVATLVVQHGFGCRLRTSLKDQDLPPLITGELLVVDTVGELDAIYRLSDLVFVGGSLVPTGGHNLLEPAAVGVPSLFGPHMENFRDVAALVLQYGAGVQVANQAELLDALHDFLVSPDLRQVIGANGLKLLRDSGGATERYLAIAAAAHQS